MAAFFLQNSFLAILILISQKLVQRGVIGEKMRSFRYSPAIIKGLKKVTNSFQTDLYPHKTVTFAKFSKKQVCNVRKKQLQCLLSLRLEP